MAEVKLENITKSYGQVQVIHGIDLDIDNGEFVVFVGPSGCGKSTLLRMIAGLEEISDGNLVIGDRRANDQTPTERGIAMVFQNYALYPHMTVEQNIGFGLKMSGYSKAAVKAKVEEAASALRLNDYLHRKPSALSGGQRQRVAIGRAIVREPQVFLFDEPLSNLDAELRVSMRIEIARLHDMLKNTMIYVTHDQTEAMTLADRIVVLNAGRIEQVGTPQELYETPANLFVAGFIGSPSMNVIKVEHAPKNLAATMEAAAATRLGIRPEHIVIGGDAAETAIKVDAVEYLGGTCFIYGSLEETQIIVEIRDGTLPKSGDIVPLHFPPERVHLFGEDGRRIARQ